MCSNSSSNPNNRHSDNVDTWSHITGNLLNVWLNDKNSNLLIIDARSSNDYLQEHIRNSINIPPSKLLKRNLLEDKTLITELLIKNSNLNKYYNDFKIVLYDKNSEHTNQLEYESFSLILLKKLAQKYKSVSFLIGGFIQFKLHYSQSCEISSNIKREENSSSTTGLSSILETHNSSNSMPISVPSSLCLRSTVPIVSSSRASINNSPVTVVPMATQNTNPYNHEITQILPFLYLGSQNDALSKEKMKSLNITYVLNVSPQCPKPDFIDDANFLRISIDDSHCAKLSPYFDVAFKFIEKCRQSNANMLIHCLAGISRSPTLAIAYTMKHLNKSFDDAYDLIKKKRPTISPNFNFLGQLLEYEKQMKSAVSSTILAAPTTSQIANSINASCQALFTITKTVASTAATTCSNAANNKAKLNLGSILIPKTRKPFVFNSSMDHHHHQCHYQKDEDDLVKITVNPVHSRPAPESPSQALAKFNFNSPQVEKSVTELFCSEESSESKDATATISTENRAYPSVKFRHHIDDVGTSSRAYMPKSLTIDSLINESDVNTTTAPPRKSTINYNKRSASENLNLIEQENDSDSSSGSNTVTTSTTAITTTTQSTSSATSNPRKQALARPSSIFINRQHLLPIKETHTNIVVVSSPTTSSSSASSMISTSPYCCSNTTPTSASSVSSSISSYGQLEFEPNKKMKLSSIQNLNPNSHLLNVNKSKSSENLASDLSSPTTTTMPSDSRSFETIKSLLDDTTNQSMSKSQSNSTKSSKSSLHGSIEKMIEVS